MKYEADNGGVSARNVSFPPPASAGERNTATGVNGNVKPSGRTYEGRRKFKSVDYHVEGYKVGKEVSDGKEQRHKKLQHSKCCVQVHQGSS